MSRPKKPLRSVVSDGWAAYQLWQGAYQNSKQAGVKDKAARRFATAGVAAQLKVSPTRVRQITREVEKARQTLLARAATKGEKLNANSNAFRQIYSAIERAVLVLRTPAYRDLLKGCAMETRFGPALPKALQHFSSAEEATAADSLQRLTSVLALAFLREHEARAKVETRPDKNQTRAAANGRFPMYRGHTEAKRLPSR